MFILTVLVWVSKIHERLSRVCVCVCVKEEESVYESTWHGLVKSIHWLLLVVGCLLFIVDNLTLWLVSKVDDRY